MIRTGPQHTEGVDLFEKALVDFKKAGAVIVDPALTGLQLTEEHLSADATTFERTAAINKYLAGLPATAPIRSVDEMIAQAPDIVKPAIIESAKLYASADHNPALAAAYKQQSVLRKSLMDLMDKYQLDAVILPYETALIWDIPLTKGANPESRNAVASFTGLPTIIVPGGVFSSDGMPFGVQFLGRPFSEPTLIKVASGYEATAPHRQAPVTTPALPGETISY